MRTSGERLQVLMDTWAPSLAMETIRACGTGADGYMNADSRHGEDSCLWYSLVRVINYYNRRTKSPYLLCFIYILMIRAINYFKPDRSFFSRVTTSLID